MEIVELTGKDIITKRLETVHRSTRRNTGYMYPSIEVKGCCLFSDPINGLVCKRRLVLPGYRTKFSIPHYHRVFPDINTMIAFIYLNMKDKTDAYLKRIENYFKVNIIEDGVDIAPLKEFIARGSDMSVDSYFASYKEFEVDDVFYEDANVFHEAFDELSKKMLKNQAKILATKKVRGNASKLYHTFEPGWYRVYKDRVRKATDGQILSTVLVDGNCIGMHSPNKAVDVFFFREVDGEQKRYWKGLNDLFSEEQLTTIRETMDLSKCVIRITSNAAIQIKKVNSIK